MRTSLLLCAFLFAGLAAAQQDVAFLTATSTDGANRVEFLNPPEGPYELTRVIGRIDRYAETFDDIDFSQPLFVVDVSGVQGQPSFVVHTGLENGRTHFYSVFVTAADGLWSEGRNVKGVPVDTTGPIRWKFFTGTGATLMSPPGIGSVVLVLSNDGSFYPLVRGPEGGRWAPGAVPSKLGQPAQHRPPVIPVSGLADVQNLSLIASQDGFLRGFDADAGTEIWTSDSYGMLQGAPGAWLSVFSGGGENLAYVGSRNAGTRNALHAVDASTGAPAWSFDDPSGPGIGIINGGVTVDYARGAAYFASHELTSGAGTVWAVDLLTGSGIWSASIGSVSGSPVLKGDVLYVGADSGLVHALEAGDGSLKLNFPFDTKDGIIKGFVFPNFVGKELYLSSQTRVWGVRDVEPVVVELWHLDLLQPSIPTYPPGRQFLWVGSGDGRLYQVDVTTGNPAQPPSTRSVILTDGSAGVGSPSFDLQNGLIYVGTEDGAVYAVAAPY